MGFDGSTSGAAYGGTFTGGGVHRFDSGLPRPLRSALRLAIVDRLGSTLTGNGRPLLKSGGGYIVKIGQLPRPLKGDSDDELALLWIALQGATPSLAVALGKMTLSPIDGNEGYLGEVEVVVYALSKNLRSFVDGRLSQDVVAVGDPTADPGVETMLEHVREILAGQSVDLIGAHELDPTFEDEVWTDSDGSLWESRFTIQIETSVNPERANSDLVTSIEGQVFSDETDQPVAGTLFQLEVQ